MSPTRTAKRRASSRQRYTVGPFKGVRTTRDPYDDPPDLLYDLVNGYIPDMPGKSGVYWRPGFVLLNGGNPIYTSATPFRGQGGDSHPALDGSTINFIAMGGHLFRVDATLSSFTDVTPVGVTIDPAITTRVSFISLIGNLVVSDGVNRPWVATNLTATPITGTYIDYDGAGVSWSSKPPFLYGGGIVYPLIQVNGVPRGADISWTEPGSVTIGLQQPNYDNNWTLSSSNSSIVNAGAGTNSAFYYFRGLSIGSATGVLGPDLASSATEDSVSFNVGAQAAQTIQQFGDSFYFCDALGRPWRFTPGSPPVPIWEQMRAIVDDATLAFQTTTAITATSAIEPTLNIWLVGIWSPNPSQQAPVTELYAFDAKSGTYMGRWIIGAGIAIDCITTFTDNAGRVTLIVMGSKDAAPATNGYVWSFNSLSSIPSFLTTEAGVLITTEGGRDITTEGQFAIWKDNDMVPMLKAVTPRIGYDPDTNLFVDMATVITGTDAPVSVAVGSSAMAETVEGTPEPSLSRDDTFRLVVGCEAFGRGPQLTVQSLAAETQGSLQSVSIVAVESAAGWDDS